MSPSQKKWPKSSKNCPQLNSSSSSNWTLFSYELETALSQKSCPKKWQKIVQKIVQVSLKTKKYVTKEENS